MPRDMMPRDRHPFRRTNGDVALHRQEKRATSPLVQATSPRIFTSPVTNGVITDVSSRGSERSGEACDDAAGGRSLSLGRGLSHAELKPDRRRSRGTSPNSRQSVAASPRAGRGSSHLRGRDSMSDTPVHVGIDVAKAKLDVCLLPTGQTLCVSNNDDGISKIIALLRQQPVVLVLLEATGR